ncbi:MAG TPA: hypothetical protein DCP32_14455 [Anaerolineaceae bacterium]|nr:hypothetical protein [Anaerolineaceae bacterium]
MSPKPAKKVTDRHENLLTYSYSAVSSKIESVKRVDASEGRRKLRLFNLGGKNRRFYATAAAMLALILVPFGLYAALNQGNQLLAGILFAIITGSMLTILFAA